MYNVTATRRHQSSLPRSANVTWHLFPRILRDVHLLSLGSSFNQTQKDIRIVMTWFASWMVCRSLFVTRISSQQSNHFM